MFFSNYQRNFGEDRDLFLHIITMVMQMKFMFLRGKLPGTDPLVPLQSYGPDPQDVEIPVMLCWECESLIKCFEKFKKRMINAHWILKKSVTQYEPPRTLSTLQKNQIYNITIPSNTDNYSDSSLTYQIIKNEFESDSETIIKEELCNDNDSDYSDDILLIDYRNLKESPKENSKFSQKHTYVNNDSSININQNIQSNRTQNKCNKNKNNDLTKYNATDNKTEKLKSKKKRKKRKQEVYKQIILSLQEIEEERLQLALKDDYINAMFRCEKCIVTFANADDLNDHINGKHKLYASNLKCEICECAFRSEMTYNYHQSKHRKRYECIICENRYPTQRGATRHFELSHYHGMNLAVENSKYELDGAVTEDGLKESDVGDLQDPQFSCDYCEKRFRWKTSLRKHVETHRIEMGEKRKPYCEPCRLTFKTTCILQKHVKTSSKHQIQLKLRKLKETNPVTTPEQEEQVKKIKKLVEKDRGIYACEQCGKIFQWKGNLYRHLRNHTARAKGNLVCGPCNKTFSSEATYKQHLAISKKHVTENDFKYMCSECGKKFATKTRLKEHVNWEHLKIYDHKCGSCMKVFKSQTSLYIHEMTHNKHQMAQHLCDYCGKSFVNPAKLRCHFQAAHSTESPYKCPVCAAKFNWRSCLSRHVRRLHRQKSFKQSDKIDDLK